MDEKDEEKNIDDEDEDDEVPLSFSDDRVKKEEVELAVELKFSDEIGAASNDPDVFVLEGVSSTNVVEFL